MKISVIIPIKNRAHLIGETLDGLLNQSFRAFEIIIVNDHSEDDLISALSIYSNEVKLIDSQGRGPGAARNTGLAVALGEAIQFFDSDDLLTSNKLQSQVDLLKRQNVDFAYGPYVKAEQIDSDWKQVGPVMQYYPLPNRRLTDLVLQGWCPITQSVLFRKSFLDKVGPWREDLMPHEDWEYWSRIALHVPAYAHERNSCVFYRQHNYQITDQGVKSIARRKDGIHASEIVKNNLAIKNTLHSKIFFRGHQAYAKLQLNKELTHSERIELSLSDYAAIKYFQICGKIERAITGTGWLRFHGAATSARVYNKYKQAFQLKH